MPAHGRSCETCLHHDVVVNPDTVPLMICRKNPPQPQASGGEVIMEVPEPTEGDLPWESAEIPEILSSTVPLVIESWPAVRPDDWCGSYVKDSDIITPYADNLPLAPEVADTPPAR